MIARALFRAVVPNQGPIAPLGGQGSLSRGCRTLHEKIPILVMNVNETFGKIFKENSEKNTFGLR